MDDRIKEKRRENWFEVMFTIEALAVDKEVVERSLKAHVEKMGRIKEALVYETEYLDNLRVEKPMKNVDFAYSQVARVKFFARDLYSLLNMVLVYGPSSVEILGPEKKEIKIDEVQNIANVVAGVVHQFAAAGLGGIVITPDK